MYDKIQPFFVQYYVFWQMHIAVYVLLQTRHPPKKYTWCLFLMNISSQPLNSFVPIFVQSPKCLTYAFSMASSKFGFCHFE